jgi:hypothetical protein
MGKVLIEIEEGKMDEFRIKKMRMKQLKRALKKVQEIISIFEEDEGTADLIAYFMDMEKEEQETGEAGDIDLKNKIFMENMLAAMKMLFNRVPDELTELVAIISKIEEDLLDEQDYDVFLDVVMECIKENDIKAMINKGKEAFTMGKNLWGGIKG